jgi:2-polyprenyl-3-methyl-5-hydroxy-6-metoxy-1,4-benzoquinol methylase
LKNITEEKPTDVLYGRTLFSTYFVSIDDIHNKTVLDIGCGFGWFELYLLRRGVKRVFGVERTQRDIVTVNKYVQDDRAEFIIGDAIQLPFPDGIFDTVVAWDVIEHIPGKAEGLMFHEVSRVLKDNGVLYLSTPNNSIIGKLCDPAWWLIGHRHYSVQTLSSFGKEAYFITVSTKIKGAWWEIIGIINLYISKWIFRRKPFFKSFYQKMQDKEYWRENGFTTIFMKFIKVGKCADVC